MKGFVLAALLTGGLALSVACGSNSNKASSAATSPAQPAATLAATGSTPVATMAAIGAATATPASRFQPATPASNPVQRVNGMVQSFDGNTVTLSQGGSFTLSPQTAITVRKPGNATDIQPGGTVAVTAKPQPDGSLLASMIVVFPSNPNFRLGQSPLDGGNLMTNATVDKVQGNSFTVTFPGGGATVMLAPDGQVMVLSTGTPADIKPGVTVNAGVLNGVAQSVSIQ